MGRTEITPEFLTLGCLWYIAFLFSTVCHEAAHALTAKLGGDDTAYRGGQVTLNPLPHMTREPVGLILLPIASYFYFGGWMMGWASAPYDPVWQNRYPRRAAWMALAGPAANFSLMLMAAALIRLGMAAGVFLAPASASFTRITVAVDPETWGFAATFLSMMFVLNLLLGAFNLIPIHPLDGNSGITLLMPERRAASFMESSRESGFGLMGIFVASVVFGKIFPYFYLFALNALYPGARYGQY